MARQNYATLTAAQRQNFITRLRNMKSAGTYDSFVRQHALVLTAGHSGPAFLPWHRQFLREFESALGMHIPYWDWTAFPAGFGAAISRPTTTAPTGSAASPFNDWRTVMYVSATNTFTTRATFGLNRRFNPALTSLPTRAQVLDCLRNYRVFDTAPYDATSQGGSFRARVEGTLLVGSETSAMHNRVHRAVGGDMNANTSPNDPIFWMHHCMIDRIWASWQQEYGINLYPASVGRQFHERDEPMFRLRSQRTPASVLDHRQYPPYDSLISF